MYSREVIQENEFLIFKRSTRQCLLTMKRIVAIFDFDGTLTNGDSLIRFLWYYCTPLVFFRNTLLSIPALVKYVFGLIDNNVAKERIFALFFTGVRQDEFVAKARFFSDSVLSNIIKSELLQRVKWHQNRGDRCILVSASMEDYLMPWAEKMGFSRVISTKPEVNSQRRLTGKFLGKNCYGAEKVRRVKEYLGSLDPFVLYVYGDSRGDKELLEIADHPFYRSSTTEKNYPQI